MAINTIAILKAYFEEGDRPSSEQYSELIDSLRHYWEDYGYFGVATPDSAPVSSTIQGFYFAKEVGTYTYYSGLVVNEGELCVLKSTADQETGIVTWAKEVIFDKSQYLSKAECYGLNIMKDTVSGYVPDINLGLNITNFTANTYQWQSKANPAAEWANITGETASTLTFDEVSAIWDSNIYVLIRCRVADSDENIIYSNAIACYQLT